MEDVKFPVLIDDSRRLASDALFIHDSRFEQLKEKMIKFSQKNLLHTDSLAGEVKAIFEMANDNQELAILVIMYCKHCITREKILEILNENI